MVTKLNEIRKASPHDLMSTAAPKPRPHFSEAEFSFPTQACGQPLLNGRVALNVGNRMVGINQIGLHGDHHGDHEKLGGLYHRVGRLQQLLVAPKNFYGDKTEDGRFQQKDYDE